MEESKEKRRKRMKGRNVEMNKNKTERMEERKIKN
jgi:hypothetical protein